MITRLPGAQRRQQIGQRLAGARPGFHDQVAILVERPLHRLRHLQLPPAKLIGQLRARQHSAGRKEVVKRGQRGRGLGSGRHGGILGE